MTIKLYLYTSRTDLLVMREDDIEEENSIKRTIRESVVPKLGCDPGPIEYTYLDGGRRMEVVLQKSGSRKRSVIAALKKNLDGMMREWARLYHYDVIFSEMTFPRDSHTMTVIDIWKKEDVRHDR